MADHKHVCPHCGGEFFDSTDRVELHAAKIRRDRAVAEWNNYSVYTIPEEVDEEFRLANWRYRQALRDPEICNKENMDLLNEQDPGWPWKEVY